MGVTKTFRRLGSRYLFFLAFEFVATGLTACLLAFGIAPYLNFFEHVHNVNVYSKEFTEPVAISIVGATWFTYVGLRIHEMLKRARQE
ncbi:MAG: hypothetical protein GKR90_27135 [Pseudomonadales bacterium]|nr:hypothetical protein [Pseudomonadales bacterium]